MTLLNTKAMRTIGMLAEEALYEGYPVAHIALFYERKRVAHRRLTLERLKRQEGARLQSRNWLR